MKPGSKGNFDFNDLQVYPWSGSTFGGIFTRYL